ncbi:hypothetical protein K1T71_013376 [Dendrolimus kikuchii]|uniref:Uncharacterized protein n=1 Tax=Dendrolimus kikuchii TaxID=765133 RepID=A0ACC1CI76_9NEOP|nr:hypothetical protein K1T71_013376 [Dendrolimus kikuchii]
MKKIASSKHRNGKLTWMPCPQNEIDLPGLAYFSPLDELIIARKKDALHDVIGKKGTGYTIFNKNGQKVFLAVQEQRCKKFDLKIFNIYGNEVIEVKKPFKCCFNSVLVWAPPGNFVGSVKQVKSCKNTFIVKNNVGEIVLKLKANGLFHFVYQIMLADEKIGTVNKWRNAEVGNVKQFGITFPVDLNVTDKAVLLGACFLIGFLKY